MSLLTLPIRTSQTQTQVNYRVSQKKRNLAFISSSFYQSFFDKIKGFLHSSETFKSNFSKVFLSLVKS